MYTVTLAIDNSLFGWTPTAENIKPIFVKDFEKKKDALSFFNQYVKDNACTKPSKKSTFAHHDGKEIACNF